MVDSFIGLFQMYYSQFIFLTLVIGCSALSVQKVSDGKIDTFVEPVKLQGIAFMKRYVNRSVSTTVKFSVITPAHPDNLSLFWLYEGDSLDVVRIKGPEPENEDVYSTEEQQTGSIKISLHLKDKGLSPGNYTLIVSETTKSSTESAQASGFVEAAPILPLFPKDRRILEGDRLLISCEVTGYPKPAKVVWRFAHIKPDLMKDADALTDAKADLAPLEDTNSTAYQFLTKGVPNDQLLFPQLPSSFNGLYECSVGDPPNGDESLILVNVKDRWAALWPFIGIVIEVAVLVTAILLYERHQMRSKPPKSETNAGTTTAATTEPSSPRLKPNNMAQQNNVNTAAEPPNESGVDGDGKQDELRLRGGVRC